MLLGIPMLSAGQVQIGIKAGYDYFWFTQPEEGHFRAKYDYPNNSFMIAGSIRQRTEHVFNLGIEIQYVNRSFGVNSNFGGLGGNTHVDVDYRIGQILLQLQPQFVVGSKVKFFIYPGIYFGTMIHSSCTGIIDSWQMGLPPITRTDTLNGSAKDYYPAFEFGISPGLGIEFPVYKTLHFVFEYSFSMNLTSISKAWGSDQVKMLNMDFEIGLAYLFKSVNSKAAER